MLLRLLRAVPLVLLVVLSTACQQLDDIKAAANAAEEIKALEVRVTELEKQLSEAQTKYDRIHEIDSSMNRYLFDSVFELKEKFPDSALLVPAKADYKIIATPGGLFTVSCESIKEYATGSEVELQIVNLLAVNATLLTLEVGYSSYETKDQENYTKNLKYASTSIDKIQNGTRKIVKLRMPEYKPDQVLNMVVTISSRGMEYKLGK